MGITQSASSLARIVGPLFAAGTWKLQGYGAAFVAGGIVMLGAVWMAIVTRRRLIEHPPGLEQAAKAG